MEKTQNQPESKSFYADKLKRAIHLLLFRRGKMPGAREWELKEKIGKNYEQVLQQLNELLSELDLEITKVSEPRSEEMNREAAPLSMSEARYIVRLKGTLGVKEAKMIGWRIDNLSALSASISYLVAKQGKAPREDLEKILAHKFGRWKAITLADIFLRTGYLEEDDAGIVSIGWRTNSEVDLRQLMTKMAEAKV
jgi:intein/homing endonuclease